ncbi:hypothetical protein CHS0354_003962 [Potamilus streckersoni]|uniref:Sushi domain-containing protein n=1 Tax=Potamilus streckersoni TaxID=2493646 RepID=A0AAE0T7K1_9BIVA|nr:hypothetical protein CHS0354_003962 [Potamilus streckersoni]
MFHLVPHCPKTLNRIVVSTDCQRMNGSECKFACKQGYKTRPGVEKVICNGAMYTPDDPCEAITCPRQFNQGRVVSNCAGMIGQRCDYECTGYGYKKNKNISFIQCTESGTWSRRTDSLCQQITCPKEIPNGVLVKGSNGLACSSAIGSRCDFECNSGFLKDPSVQSLYCLVDGWAQDIQTLCIVPLAVSSEHHGQAHPAIIAIGVGAGVSIVIVIIFIFLRRKSISSKFALKRMEEEVMSGPEMQMSTRFSFDEDRVDDYVQYDNYPVNINDPNKRKEPNQLSLTPKKTCTGTSTKYDSAIAIPRPHAKENTWNRMP